jgi:hypothetical protein
MIAFTFPKGVVRSCLNEKSGHPLFHYCQCPAYASAVFPYRSELLPYIAEGFGQIVLGRLGSLPDILPTLGGRATGLGQPGHKRAPTFSVWLSLATIVHDVTATALSASPRDDLPESCWASKNRSRLCERSNAASHEQNQQDDDHKRHQPTTDVHDKSPFLRLARVHPWSLRLS